MEPRELSATQWGEISRLLIYLYLFTGLGLTAALSFLFGHAIVPSLVATRDVSWLAGGLRWVAYPISALAVVLTVYALAKALALAGDVMQQIYPRLWI